MGNEFRYKEKFIAFIDILGFKNLINKSGEKIIERVVNTIEESLDAYKEHFVPDHSTSDTDMMGYKVLDVEPKYYLMSDSIILTMDDKENNLFRFLIGITTIQRRFIAHNIFVRGAVVKGKIFETTASDGTSKIVFGRGGNEATRMESIDAIYPRIVVNGAILGGLKEKYSNPRVKSDIGQELFRLIVLKDNNGVSFIDYLSYEMLLPLLTKGDVRFIEVHKNNILKCLDDSKNLESKERYKARTKFLLLSEYHDYILNQNKELLKDREDLPGYQKLSIGIRVKRKPFFSRPF